MHCASRLLTTSSSSPGAATATCYAASSYSCSSPPSLRDGAGDRVVALVRSAPVRLPAAVPARSPKRLDAERDDLIPARARLTSATARHRNRRSTRCECPFLAGTTRPSAGRSFALLAVGLPFLKQRPEGAFFGMGIKGDRFGLGWQPTGCETQHDLVFACARETEIYRATAQRYSPRPHFGATHPRRHPRGVIPWIAACRLVWTRRIGPCSAACGRGSGLNRGTGISSSEPCQRSVTRGSVPFG